MKKAAIVIGIIFSMLAYSKAEVNYLNEVQENFLDADFEKTVKICDEWMESDKDSALAYFYKAYSLYALNYLDDAKENLDKAMEIEGGISEFLSASEELVSKNPDNPYALTALGDAYNRADNDEKAVDVLLKSIDIDPGFGPSYYVLGFIYIKQGKKDLAQETYEKGIDKASDFLGNYQYAAPHYIKTKEIKKAEKLFKKAIKKVKDPKQTAYFHNRLGDIYILREKYDDAMDVLKIGLEMKEDNFGLLLSLGDVYFKKDEIEKAKDAYLRAKVALGERDTIKGRCGNCRAALEKRLKDVGLLKEKD